MTASIIASDSSTFGILREVLPSTNYELPATKGMINKYLLPCSGGNDSTALAILLCCLFPHIDWILLFTDTKAEPQATMDNLTLLEETLGRKIVRLVPEMGLFERIDHYGGFLPSQRQRWCTRELKILPFDKYIRENLAGENVRVWSFVGIRADENRFGFISEDDDLQMVFPFKAMGVDREAVYEIVNRTLGIARTYQSRSRSGCTPCPFQRRSEIVGLLLETPKDFEKGLSYEKLAARDVERFKKFEEWKGQLTQDVDLKALVFPVPTKIDARDFHLPEVKRTVHGIQAGQSLDLFGLTEDSLFDDLYVAVSFHTMPELNLWNSGVESSGVWLQNFITYSTSLGGMKKAMNYYMTHRLSTPEVWSLSKDQLKRELNIGIFHLRVKKGVLDLQSVDSDSYTWRSDGNSYTQLKHTVKVAHEVLYRAFLESEAERYRGAEELTWEYEQLEHYTSVLAALGEGSGTIHWSGRFEVPDEARLVELTSPKTAADMRAANDSGESKSLCFACSI